MSDWIDREVQDIVDLVREVGVYRLCSRDGCTCGGFTVRNVEVEVSCGKGFDRGVRVFSNHFDYHGREDSLLPVAREVARQVEEDDGRGPVPVIAAPCAAISMGIPEIRG